MGPLETSPIDMKADGTQNHRDAHRAIARERIMRILCVWFAGVRGRGGPSDAFADEDAGKGKSARAAARG